MEQLAKHKRVIRMIFWIAVISSWLSFLFYFSVPFGLVFWIIVLIYLFIKRTKLKWYLLLASSWTLVPFLSFVLGSKDYFQGKAAIETNGMPSGEFFNLDPDLRAWNSTSGCIVIGYESFTQVPNNWAVRFWTKLLGPQKGAYTGIYPTKEQAKEIIHKGEQVNYSQSADTLFFDYSNQHFILESLNYNDLEILKTSAKGKFYILENECLLFEALGDTTKRVIYLAERKNGKIFARYYDF